MSEKEFLAALTGHGSDLTLALEALRATGQPFCLIGGLAVNHYTEPVVTLDAHFVLGAVGGVAEALRARGFEVEAFPHSVNAQLPGSRLRLQLTVNSRYASFPARAVPGKVLGYDVPVACLEDLVQGKLWAAGDPARRASKRLKDRLDLTRLCESHPRLLPLIPPGLVPEVDELRSTR
jgi:hypothetical protein